MHVQYILNMIYKDKIVSHAFVAKQKWKVDTYIVKVGKLGELHSDGLTLSQLDLGIDP